MKDLLPVFDLPTLRPMVIAGPCSAESEEQVMATATELAAGGIKVFRAGAWKPRTRPGTFEGHGEKALPWLAKVESATGMKVITEVATPDHLRMVRDAGLRAVWIGARTMANPFAVQEIADTLASFDENLKKEFTVLLKNPVNPDPELWIGQIERIYESGIRRIGAIHRGFSHYGHDVYRNRPCWAIPIELKRRIPGLPIFCDPSHIGGRRDLIAELSQQALDLNSDGLIIETHPSPDAALSDASQQITPAELLNLMRSLTVPDEGYPTESLDALRRDIDRIDEELMDLLAQRMEVARQIGRYKKRNKVSVVQPKRYNELIEKHCAAASKQGLSERFIRNVLTAVHEESVRQQLHIKED